MPGDDHTEEYTERDDAKWQRLKKELNLLSESESDEESTSKGSESVEKDNSDKDDEEGQRRICHPPHEETVYLGSDAVLIRRRIRKERFGISGPQYS